MNISRHGRLSWKVRFLNGTQAPDMWKDVATSYSDYIRATVTDANGNSYAYGLSDIKVEATEKEGWYTMTVDLRKATSVDFSTLAGFTFQVTDGVYADTTLGSCNMRLDNLTAVPAIPLEKGDVNGDGSVDIRDLVRFKRYEAKDDVEFFAEAADINGDAEITSQDIASLRKVLLGIEIETSEYALLSNDGWSETVKP